VWCDTDFATPGKHRLDHPQTARLHRQSADGTRLATAATTWSCSSRFALDADSSEFVQLSAQSMPQRTFGTQLFEQRFTSGNRFKCHASTAVK
jgi:hypothetical protein